MYNMCNIFITHTDLQSLNNNLWFPEYDRWLHIILIINKNGQFICMSITHLNLYSCCH